MIKPDDVSNFTSTDYLFVRYTDPEEIKQACGKAAHHRLAVSGWTFFDIFRAGRVGDRTEYDVDKIALAYNNHTGEPVGAAVGFGGWGSYNAGCFVRNDLRRQRIGSRLVNTLLVGETRPVRIHDGIVGSSNFWKVMGADLGYIRDT